MAFREVSDLSADVTISLGGTNRKTGKVNPNKVEGYYLGSRQVADKKKKDGVSNIYFLQTPKGNVGVWGKTDMDRKMGGVKPGTMIKIEFDRMVPTPNGEMYKFKVSIDEDNTIELVGATPSANALALSDDSADAEDEDTSSYSDQDEDSQVAELAASERRAKVAALLSKNKLK